MSQRGFNNRPNFSFNKYNPLQLRGLEQQQQNPRPTAPPFPQLPFALRQPNNVVTGTIANDGSNSSIVEATAVEPQQGMLYDSIDNITLWCQQQERCKREVEKQLENSLAEVGRLKSRLEIAANEIHSLQDVNKQLQESHERTKESVEETNALCDEVKASFFGTVEILQGLSKERATWITNHETMQRKHYDKRVELLQADFQKKMESKDAQLVSMQSEFQKRIESKDAQFNLLRSNTEQNAAHLNEGLAELENLNKKITEANNRAQMYQTVNQSLSDKLNTLSGMLDQEKSQNQILAQQLSESQRCCENLKSSLSNMSNERAALQEQFQLLEAKNTSTMDALNDSIAHTEQLEKSVLDLNVKLEEDSKLKDQTQQLLQEMTEKISENTKAQDLQSKEMERISGQLSASNEHIRQLQETVDEKSRSVDDALTQFVEQQKSNAELEKELAALKSELMNSSIQLDYNKQRVEELEKQLQDAKLQLEKQVPKVASLPVPVPTTVDTTKSTLPVEPLENQSETEMFKSPLPVPTVSKKTSCVGKKDESSKAALPDPVKLSKLMEIARAKAQETEQLRQGGGTSPSSDDSSPDKSSDKRRRSLSNEDVLESPKTRRQHKSLTASTAMDPTDYVAPSPILRSKSGVATSRFSVHDSSTSGYIEDSNEDMDAE